MKIIDKKAWPLSTILTAITASSLVFTIISIILFFIVQTYSVNMSIINLLLFSVFGSLCNMFFSTFVSKGALKFIHFLLLFIVLFLIIAFSIFVIDFTYLLYIFRLND